MAGKFRPNSISILSMSIRCGDSLFWTALLGRYGIALKEASSFAKSSFESPLSNGQREKFLDGIGCVCYTEGKYIIEVHKTEWLLVCDQSATEFMMKCVAKESRLVKIVCTGPTTISAEALDCLI